MMFLDLQTSIRLSSLFLLACAALAGCDEAKLDVRDPKPDSGLERDADAVTDPEPVPCEGAADGDSCGDDRHCIKQQCLVNTCGDGIQAALEECDDGNEALGDMCTPACETIKPTCGNAELDDGEECDDGNLQIEDGCAPSCTRIVCGNMRVDPREDCDDGNRVDGDACSNACTRHLCRNDPGEECDDANTNANDGCTNACQLIACGDGVPEQQEECDDGNRVDTDGCSNACRANICGNGRIDPGEVCDSELKADGQAIPSGSRCNTSCSEVLSDEACKRCEREAHCSNYQDTGFDLPKFCYDEVPEDSLDTIKEPLQKCAAMVECIKRNRCDIDWAIPGTALACYCGKSNGLDNCNATNPSPPLDGPCIAEIEAAAGVIPGDNVGVNNFLVDLTRPSGRAFYLAQCQRENCREQCR
jgi:cysteine-rich repeat protein